MAQNHLDEIDAMERARSVGHGVNVPAIRRVVPFFPEEGHLIQVVMERIHGETLATSWNMGYYPHCLAAQIVCIYSRHLANTFWFIKT